MNRIDRLLAGVLIALVRAYQALFPTVKLAFGIQGHCRYQPCCSQFAVSAIRDRGALWGAWAAIKRVSSCH